MGRDRQSWSAEQTNAVDVCKPLCIKKTNTILANWAYLGMKSIPRTSGEKKRNGVHALSSIEKMLDDRATRSLQILKDARYFRNPSAKWWKNSSQGNWNDFFLCKHSEISLDVTKTILFRNGSSRPTSSSRPAQRRAFEVELLHPRSFTARWKNDGGKTILSFWDVNFQTSRGVRAGCFLKVDWSCPDVSGKGFTSATLIWKVGVLFWLLIWCLNFL